jgi:multisubunit Na+/H+ antiporter MnhG subunit
MMSCYFASQVATFINTNGVQLPFFGVVIFYANLLFLGLYFVFQVSLLIFFVLLCGSVVVIARCATTSLTFQQWVCSGVKSSCC